MSERDFAGRTALITGGSRGIGREIAINLARHGADVAIIYRSRDADARATKESVEREGVKCVLAKGDVSNPSDVEVAVSKTRQELGPISLLVTSAAVLVSSGGHLGKLEEDLVRQLRRGLSLHHGR